MCALEGYWYSGDKSLLQQSNKSDKRLRVAFYITLRYNKKKTVPLCCLENNMNVKIYLTSMNILLTRLVISSPSLYPKISELNLQIV